MKEYRYSSGFKINCEKGSVPLIKCSGISFPHGFSTRLGGVSTEAGYDTLDLGAGALSSDIDENRKRFVSSVLNGGKLVFAEKQLHSAKVEYINEENMMNTFECDGFVTDKKGIVIAVKTADCVPILFCDSESRIIGAVHAGWRGTVSGIARECIIKMSAIGAKPENITAAVGPCIHSECYIVDEKFVDAVRASACADICLPFIKENCSGGYTADLAMMNREILLSCGISENKIFTSGMCTSCLNDLLFSHRAGKGRRGLMMSGICLGE